MPAQRIRRVSGRELQRLARSEIRLSDVDSGKTLERVAEVVQPETQPAGRISGTPDMGQQASGQSGTFMTASQLWFPDAEAGRERGSIRNFQDPSDPNLNRVVMAWLRPEVEAFLEDTPQNTDEVERFFGNASIDAFMGSGSVGSIDTHLRFRCLKQGYQDGNLDADLIQQFFYTDETSLLRPAVWWEFWRNLSDGMGGTTNTQIGDGLLTPVSLDDADDNLDFRGLGRARDLVQGGTETVTGDGTNTKFKTITFPQAFSAAPVSVVATNNDPEYIASADQLTATTFRLGVKKRDGANWSGNQFPHWIALGPNA